LEEEEEEKKKKEEKKVEEENALVDLEDPSPSFPLEYPEEEILFAIIINQLNFIYLLSALTIEQENEEEEEK